VTIATVVATVLSYALNRRWVFPHQRVRLVQGGAQPPKPEERAA